MTEETKTVVITNVTPPATLRLPPTDISNPPSFYQTLSTCSYIDAQGVPCRPLWYD